jgi:16S rRNA (guanine966-N2)-methyltransferase
MPLRVNAGSARGVQLRTPPGAVTRPTSARLRESLFAMLEAADADFDSVLDLYAGSGALGIEALSRGAAHCLFVESNYRACRVIRDNLGRAGVSERGEVMTARIGHWRPSEGAIFTLVLADPPYDDIGSWLAIERAIDGALAPTVLIAVEHAARNEAPVSLGGCPIWRQRRQGDGAVAAYGYTDTSVEYRSGERL